MATGDNSVKIWDVLGGGRMASSFSNHQKAITAIALDSSSSRLLTASLDQMVKFHDVTSYQVTHTMKFESPILAMGISVCLERVHSRCTSVTHSYHHFLNVLLSRHASAYEQAACSRHARWFAVGQAACGSR